MQTAFKTASKKLTKFIITYNYINIINYVQGYYGLQGQCTTLILW